MTYTLTTETRDAKGNLEALRAADKVPAVMYGVGIESTPIAVPHKETVKLYKEAGGSTLITLETALGTKKALIHDVDLDPVSHKLRHVDFLIVDENKPLTVAIPLTFIGEAPAEKAGLGVLSKSLHEIEIEVPAKDLPHSLEVDLSSIATLDDNIYVRDVVIPASATLVTDGDVIVASVTTVKEEVEGTDTIDFDAIAVVEKGKKESAEEESEEK